MPTSYETAARFAWSASKRLLRGARGGLMDDFALRRLVDVAQEQDVPEPLKRMANRSLAALTTRLDTAREARK